MNELTKQLSTMLVPEMAIIVYSDDNRTNLYLERRHSQWQYGCRKAPHRRMYQRHSRPRPQSCQ